MRDVNAAHPTPAQFASEDVAGTERRMDLVAQEVSYGGDGREGR
jgi:hypothetical protein